MLYETHACISENQERQVCFRVLCPLVHSVSTADAAVVQASKQHRVELSIPSGFGVAFGFRAAVHVDENRSARTSAPRLRDFFGVV